MRVRVREQERDGDRERIKKQRSQVQITVLRNVAIKTRRTKRWRTTNGLRHFVLMWEARPCVCGWLSFSTTIPTPQKRRELRTQETGGVVERVMSLGREEQMMSSAQWRGWPNLRTWTTGSTGTGRNAELEEYWWSRAEELVGGLFWLLISLSEIRWRKERWRFKGIGEGVKRQSPTTETKWGCQALSGGLLGSSRLSAVTVNILHVLLQNRVKPLTCRHQIGRELPQALRLGFARWVMWGKTVQRSWVVRTIQDGQEVSEG